MACSRMPKCRVRPYALPGNISVWCSAGMNDGSPFIVVLLLPARSAEPPHSSGSTGARAFSTSPEALRVAMPLASGREGRQRPVQPVRQPPGGQPVQQRGPLRVGAGPARRSASSHSACSRLPRSATLRACATSASSTGNVTSGSKPRIRLVAATSSAPSAEPCALPVFCLFGAGQPMMVRSAMMEGWSVLAWRRSSAGTAPADVLVVAVRACAPVDPLDVPAVGLVAGGDVLGLGDLGVVLDRDLVVVVEHDEVAELLVAGQRGGLVADALLDVAVRGEARRRGGRTGWSRRARPGRAGRARGGRPWPCRPRWPGPGRAGRWWSPRPGCGRAPGGPGSGCPTSAAP